MTPETDLNEVAALLPKNAAVALAYQPAIRQARILTRVRQALCYWEENGVDLDPIAQAFILETFVLELLGLYVGMLDHLQQHGVSTESWEAKP